MPPRQRVALAQIRVLEVLRKVTLEHAFGRIARIVIDRDLGAGRIALERRVDVEGTFVADADARAVQGAAADLEFVFDRWHVLHRLRLAFELVAPRLDARAQDAAGGRQPAFRLTQLDQLAGGGDDDKRNHRQEDQADPEIIGIAERHMMADEAWHPVLHGEGKSHQADHGDHDDYRRERRVSAAAPLQWPGIRHEFDLRCARRRLRRWRVVWHRCPPRFDHVVANWSAKASNRFNTPLNRVRRRCD